MNDTEPKYITELREHIDNKIETHIPKYFTEFKKEFTDFKTDLHKKLDDRFNKIDTRFNKIDTTLDSHQEFMAGMAVDITEIKQGQKEMKSDIGIIKGDMV